MGANQQTNKTKQTTDADRTGQDRPGMARAQLSAGAGTYERVYVSVCLQVLQRSTFAQLL
ncbi:hypothetical protein DAKH74_056060 [Maudiozyma humilis]|uniref:Uncharacterized protein n=1 Tax=Maudiozyma humilis TaxID=51915 RepID=A0AAV5S558_MAUHU|nr:hypothetical protein DAKH74_056060 [Kazachstania humilis]